MTIKAKLFAISVLPAVLALLASGVLIVAAWDVARVRQKQTLAHEIMKGVFELNMLAYQYLQHPGERPQQQWQRRHVSLAKLLVGLDFLKQEDRKMLLSTREGHKVLGRLFAELIAQYHGPAGTARGGGVVREFEERLTGQFLSRSHALVSQASRLASASNINAVAIEYRTRVLVIFVLGLIAVVVAAVAFWTSRSIVRPIENLREGTESVGAGNLAYTFAHQSEDEIGQLSKAFNEMTRRLGTITVSRDELAKEVVMRKRVEHERLAYEQKLRSMASRLALAEERERRRIATGLHDQIGQSLAMAKVNLGRLQQESSQDLAATWDQARGLIEEAITATRSLTFELGSPVLYELGLAAALESLAQDLQEQQEIQCMIDGNGQIPQFGEDVSVVLYQAVREAILNAVKHAQATMVKISLNSQSRKFTICVADDGLGFVVPQEGFRASSAGGFGLFSIGERLESLGGQLELVLKQANFE